MEKILYISDLDGTLLNNKKQVSQQSADILNELIEEQGVHFSVATARTPATVEHILKDIDMKQPIIVMNGVGLYDLQTHQYSQVEYIDTIYVKEIMETLGDWLSQGFIYTLSDHQLTVHYDVLEGKGRINFYEERKQLERKKFTRAPLINATQIIYFVFIDTKERIETIHNLLQDIQGIGLVMYKDIYDEESYLLEVYSIKATKANGIKKLRQLGHYQKVICFGDQMNDLNMFVEAEEAYAVENAISTLKDKATAVIGSNEEDSVAKYIQQHIVK